jgi:hypothetical protein
MNKKYLALISRIEDELMEIDSYAVKYLPDGRE